MFTVDQIKEAVVVLNFEAANDFSREMPDSTDPNTGVPVKSYFVDDIVKKYLELPPKK